jgi:hypothetical protein
VTFPLGGPPPNDVGGGARGDAALRSIMTPEGLAMFDTATPEKLPGNNCQSPGLPNVAMMPELQEWSVSRDKLLIHHEAFESTRVIHLNHSAHPVGEHTPGGHAFGSIADGKVTIETANLTTAFQGLGRNAPGSDSRVVKETYWLVDHDTMRGEIEINDPQFLIRPLKLQLTLRRAPPGTRIEYFPCDLATSRWELGRGEDPTTR